MEINIHSHTFDDGQYGSSLRDEIDQYANQFLESAKESAADRIKQIGPNQNLDEEQKEIDALFSENRGALKAYLNNQIGGRLSSKEIDAYLDDFQTAWSEHFNVRAAAASSSSGDLNTALTQANAWLASTTPNTPVNGLAKLLQETIESMISQGKSMSDLQNWANTALNNPDYDLYFISGVGKQSDMQQFCNICETGTAPPPTPMDVISAEFSAWTTSHTLSEPDKKLFSWLAVQILQLESHGDPNALKALAQKIVDSGYSDYGAISGAADDEFQKLTGASDFNNTQTQLEAYLAQRGTSLAQMLALLKLPMPKTEAEWARLSKICAIQVAKMKADMAQCHTDSDWQKLGVKYGLSGNIQEAASERIKNLDQAPSYPSAFLLFEALSKEITVLQGEDKNLQDLKAWAQTIDFNDYPGLSPEDVADFQHLAGL